MSMGRGTVANRAQVAVKYYGPPTVRRCCALIQPHDSPVYIARHTRP